MSFISVDHQRGTARRRLVLITAGVVMVATAVVVYFAVFAGNGGRERKRVSAPASSPTAEPRDRGSASPTVLPKPKSVKDGVPVGYPHTVEGAVSAAAHYSDVGDLFTPETAERQAHVTAEPGFQELMAGFAKAAAQEARKTHGLPPDGESDQGSYYARQARAYHIISQSPGKVSLWLLEETTVSVRGVLSEQGPGVHGAIMTWANGDWHLSVDLVIGQHDEEPPAVVTPGSPEAVREGWRALAYEK
ncbi:hypothetical protein ACSNOK_14980 [Streptomyces sp. URMC 126]|uniref:hypothetical protein n=1 Tax=Streptomyces sp. URMC 126 TaxID=3423401 RepID=UPI003F1A3D10